MGNGLNKHPYYVKTNVARELSFGKVYCFIFTEKVYYEDKDDFY